MKYFLNFFWYLSIFFLITACSGFKESLSLKKKEGVDEFLIERKNPLSVPPDFSSLPKPKDSVEKDVLEEEDLDLKKVINETQKTNQTGSSDNLEKSISDILNKR